MVGGGHWRQIRVCTRFVSDLIHLRVNKACKEFKSSRQCSLANTDIVCPATWTKVK